MVPSAKTSLLTDEGPSVYWDMFCERRRECEGVTTTSVVLPSAPPFVGPSQCLSRVPRNFSPAGFDCERPSEVVRAFETVHRPTNALSPMVYPRHADPPRLPGVGAKGRLGRLAPHHTVASCRAPQGARSLPSQKPLCPEDLGRCLRVMEQLQRGVPQHVVYGVVGLATASPLTNGAYPTLPPSQPAWHPAGPLRAGGGVPDRLARKRRCVCPCR